MSRMLKTEKDNRDADSIFEVQAIARKRATGARIAPAIYTLSTMLAKMRAEPQVDVQLVLTRIAVFLYPDDRLPICGK
jgi:hypothetical protein